MRADRKAEIKRRLFADMYSEIAIDAYPEGARFNCNTCNYTFRASAENCEEYFIKGWPRHCNELMAISKPEES